MTSGPSWLTVSDLIVINRLIVAETGEPFGVLNPGGLESAQAKPRNHHAYGEEDIVVLAVELCLGLARNHCFVQGNKRTAFVAMDNFLLINGYVLDLPDGNETADALVAVIERQMPEHLFIQFVDSNVH